MGREPVRFAIPVVEDLNLNGSQERLTQRRHRARPDKHPCIAARLEVPPLQLQDEILVLALGAQGSGRNAIAVDHALPDRERLRGAVDVDPPPQIPAIEDRPEDRLRSRHRQCHEEE